MKNKKGLVIIGLFITSLIFGISLGTIRADDTVDTIISAQTDSSPTIDGAFDDEAEWEDAELTSFYHSNPSVGHPPEWVYIYTMHTEDKLFMLIDDIPDITNDTDDTLPIYFDCDKDGSMDNNIGMDLGKDYSNLYGGNSLAEWKVGFGPSINNNSDHTIFEIAINITLDSAYDGNSEPSEMDYTLPVGTEDNSIRIGINAPPSICNWTVPHDLVDSDPSTYATLEFEVDEKSDDSDDNPDESIPFGNIGTISLISTISILGVILITLKRRAI